MKDFLEVCLKDLKYDEPIRIEKRKKKSTGETTMIRLIGELRKGLNSTTFYSKDIKDPFFDHPIYQMFPSKTVTIKNVEHVSYVSKVTNDEDITMCLKKIENVISNIYLGDTAYQDVFFSEDLLSLFMEICRQVAVLNYDIGVLLKHVFNYKLCLLNQYHRLFKSALHTNINKQLSHDKLLKGLKTEIENKKKITNSLKNETIDVDEEIANETITTERKLSEMNIIYQNKTENLKKNNQRKKEEFTRIIRS